MSRRTVHSTAPGRPRPRRRLLALTAFVAASALTTGVTSASVQSAFSARGPYATTTSRATDSAGRTFDLFYPANYRALHFESPIVTWGNGTNATPGAYSTLLTHLASYGFTVVASTLANTGSGNEIDAGARYLVSQDTTAGSVFRHHLDRHEVAAVGHSQGAGGATRAALHDPAGIKALMTFSLPNTIWVGANPDCPQASACSYDPADLEQPAFFIATYGFLDSIIAPPHVELSYYNEVHGHAVLGLIGQSEGKAADHNSIQDASHGGNPDGELGYATAWLEYQLRHSRFAARAFRGPRPEITRDPNWPGSRAK